MRLVFIAAAIATCAFLAGGCSQENCLKKYGYNSCDHLRKAMNLKNSDEAQRFLDICKKCGCGDCGDTK